MANKSGDSSLRDWFSKSKSSDGKPGWVQLGGKYAGKPCAKQPGQTTKPKCGSSKMKRNLSKDEEEAAFRRKNKKDPNPNRSGKAINVKTEEFVQEGGLARAMSKSKTQTTGHISADRGSDEKANRAKRKGLEKDLKKHGVGYKKGVGEYKYGSGETGREVSYHTSPGKGMSKRRFGKVMRRLGRKHGQESVITKDKNKPAKLHYTEKGSKAKSDNIGKTKVGKHPEGYGETSSTKVRSGKLPTKTKDRKFHYGEEKDACYHKVKSRYKVWPSAYASGALVKCRKKGADNWGNSTKKEGFTPSQIAALESIGAIEINEAGKKCWKGYKKVGTQKLFGKTYNRCEKEEVENVSGQADSSPVTEAVTVPRENGQLMRVFLTFRGKFYMVQLFFPSLKTPTKQEVTDAVQKVYPDARVTQYMRSTIDPSQPLVRVTEQTETKDKATANQDLQIQRKQLVLNRQKLKLQQKAIQRGGKTDMHVQEGAEQRYCPKCEKLETKSECSYGPEYWEKNAKKQTNEAAAWTRKAGKNKEGGLNEKGRKSYERENPGSDLKAPSKKVGNPRRASFCARMKGMKKKLTSAKTASDPDSRINKSLRAWNC
tara:strand:- start:475 stop:2268 length:1794 start_codon:yes stop_codon:yes gene_type:complete